MIKAYNYNENNWLFLKFEMKFMREPALYIHTILRVYYFQVLAKVESVFRESKLNFNFYDIKNTILSCEWFTFL